MATDGFPAHLPGHKL